MPPSARVLARSHAVVTHCDRRAGRPRCILVADESTSTAIAAGARQCDARALRDRLRRSLGARRILGPLGELPRLGKVTMDWKQYQRDVAAFLSSLGFETKVDETIRGARAKHNIDVTARTSIAGVKQLWIVECKLWKRPVAKERFLTFRAIVEDVGADRGVLFSESGFQSGAKAAAQNTNISLTSFADFERNFSNDVSVARAKTLDSRLANLMQAFNRLWDLPKPVRESAFGKYCGPPGLLGLEQTPHAVVGVTSRLSQMRQALEDAQFGRWPVAFYPLDHQDNELIEVRVWEGLFFVVEHTLEASERIYAHMIDPETGEADWRDFQSAELTELLRDIRSAASSS